MYVLDRDAVRQAIKESSYGTLQALAKALGLHRNSLSYFLKGRSVFPQTLEKMFVALNLDPAKVILLRKGPNDISQTLRPFATLIDRLLRQFPDVAWVAFGSRVTKRSTNYSDLDLGVFRAEGLPHDEYVRMILAKDDLAEDLPYFVDLVNLNRATPSFLRNISKGCIYLGGRFQDWLQLQARCT